MRHKTTNLSVFLLLSCLINVSACKQDDTCKTVYDKAIKEYHYGIPFLYLEGSDYEVGIQYGFLLKKELNGIFIGFNDYKDKMMSREFKYLPWYKRIPAKIFGSTVLKFKINKLAKKLPEDLNEQLKGMAKGSGLPVSFFYEINLFGDFMAHSCCSFIIRKNGKMYNFRNLDTPLSLLANYPVVANYKITGKQKYTNIGFVSGLMISNGFNESGISFSECSNNNPKPFEKNNSNLLVERNNIITQARNLNQVDSIVNSLVIPLAYIYSIVSSKECKANVYDAIGTEKAITQVDKYQYVAGRIISKTLLKKNELIYAGGFHNTAREIKFSELIDTTKNDIIDLGINILSNTDFYHYSDSISVQIESINNYSTIQSVAYDLADSSVYFSYNTSFAAWGKWLKYNYITREVNIYKEPNQKINMPGVTKCKDIFEEYQNCDRRDSSDIRKLVNSIISSNIQNYFTLNFLSTKFLDYYHMPSKALIYADKLISKYPDIATGYYNKGLILESQKQYIGAIDEYNKALECKINCEYYKALLYEHLAYSYNSISNDKAAKEKAIIALDINNQYWIPDWFKDKIANLKKIIKTE